MMKVNNKALVITILPAITGLILGVAVGLSTLAPPLGKFILMLMAGTYFSVMFGLPVYLLALKLVIPNEYFNKRTEKM
jgi:hypothetical protein